MKWWGWGHTEARFNLKDPSGFWAHLQSALGPLPEAERVETIARIPLPASRLSPSEIAALDRITGPEGVCSDSEARLTHALGKSYIDLVRVRNGRIQTAPDAVIFPEHADQIVSILQLADEKGWAVIPFGGGTTVVGGIEAEEEKVTIILDLQRMNRVVAVDPLSQTARVQCGIMGPELEKRLNAEGLTLGHFPQSFEFSTLGGWIATRSAGQNSTKYGKIEHMVTGLRVVSPRGTHTVAAMPAEAVGPSLLQCLVGSEGALGVITEATLRLHALPTHRAFAGYVMPGFLSGVDTVRKLLQADLRPAVIRLSDPEETRLALLLGRSSQSSARDDLLRRYLKLRGIPAEKGSLLIMIFEGAGRDVHAARRRAGRQVKHGVCLGSLPAKLWLKSRFEHPYLRDDLLDRSVMVDTLETAATWDKIPALYAGVRRSLAEAINKTAPGCLVMTHLSHAYPDGASLYFTFMGRQAAGEELEQWLSVKAAATAAILENGGTLSHHHGIGTMHKAWMRRYLGVEGIEWLQMMKSGMDPKHIMNPGKLF